MAGETQRSSLSSSSTGAANQQYTAAYTDLDDILALSKRVSCRFFNGAPKLGFIDAASECEDIPEATQLELPLWLAKTLHSRGLVTVDCPKGYNETYRDILEADATVVDLHKLGPHFYKFGNHLSKMNIPESEDIAKSMLQTFHQRVHKIMDFSLNAAEGTPEMVSFQSNLDNSEATFLEEGKKCAKDMKKWENRTLEKVCANNLVISLKKRKLAEMECCENPRD